MTAPGRPELAFEDLDPGLVVWGVALPFDAGVYQVFAKRTREDAELQAQLDAEHLFEDPVRWEFLLVYHHPDRGWVFWDSGEDCITL